LIGIIDYWQIIGALLVRPVFDVCNIYGVICMIIFYSVHVKFST